MRYRPEIDGLRAIALIPVMLFHAGAQGFSGGYVGVDIFFVISGYLITLTVLEERRQGTFSIFGFYERRARRIMPALLLVMAVCIPFAVLWMLPDYLENFGQSLVATLLFGNNFLLFHTSGYFTLEAEFKPLLHTWSLGLEEQFYLIFPLGAALAWGQPRKRALLIVLCLLAISLFFAHRQSELEPLKAYYFPHTRAWQLLLGVGLALLAPQVSLTAADRSSVVSNLAAVAGLVMIGYAVTCFDTRTKIPGLPALVPAVGTALVLQFAGQTNRVGQALGHRWLVGLGLVSYSAYLWHQPLFAFARVRSLEQPGSAVFGALGLCAFLLAYASWKYVEVPFRKRGCIARRPLLVTLGASVALIGAIGFHFHRSAGFVVPQRMLDKEAAELSRWTNATYNAEPNRLKDQGFVSSGKLRVLVVGNSFARDFINAGVANNYWSKSELSYSDASLACIQLESLEARLKQRIAQADYLIFGSPSVDVHCWQEDLRILRSIGARNVIVVGGKNFGWNMNAVMLLDEPVRREYRARVNVGDDAWNTRLAATVGPEHYVNLLQMLMDEQRRVPVFTPEGKLISQDRRHLTRAGAAYVGQLLFEHRLLQPLK